MSAPVNRQPAGTPAGGQFATTGKGEADVTVAVDQSPEARASRELDAALEALRAANDATVKATTHLLAVEVLRTYPDAAYLHINEHDPSGYGYVIGAEAVLGDDGERLVEDLEYEDPDLAEAVRELASAYPSLAAVTDELTVLEVSGRPDGRRRLGSDERHIDLRAARALYDVEALPEACERIAARDGQHAVDRFLATYYPDIAHARAAAASSGA